ncbi:hypothetical protein CDIK_1543 [Cucumispora dikerogammari]|nr:hypothetical protein CDIK_1543 [Cucumispora dikerogammari]
MQMSIRGAQLYQYRARFSNYGMTIFYFFTSSLVSDLLAKICWFIDGTFKTTPIIFYKLFSISYINNHNVFSCIFVLLNNKIDHICKNVEKIISFISQNKFFYYYQRFRKSIVERYKNLCFRYSSSRLFLLLNQKRLLKSMRQWFKKDYNTDLVFKKQIKLLMALAYPEVNEMREVFHELYFFRRVINRINNNIRLF